MLDSLILSHNTVEPNVAVEIESVTTAERDMLSNLDEGIVVIFNITINKLQYYNGTSWENLTTSPES